MIQALCKTVLVTHSTAFSVTLIYSVFQTCSREMYLKVLVTLIVAPKRKNEHFRSLDTVKVVAGLTERITNKRVYFCF